jgi:hypothetical protein
MNRAAPLAREIARLIVSVEASGDNSAEAQARAVLRGCEKLRVQLTSVVGTGGYVALASRALALARVDRGLPPTVRITENGSLEGLAEFASNLQPFVAETDAQAIVAQLLNLLLAFIGEALVLGLIRNVWPDMPIEGLGTGAEETV